MRAGPHVLLFLPRVVYHIVNNDVLHPIVEMPDDRRINNDNHITFHRDGELYICFTSELYNGGFKKDFCVHYYKYDVSGGTFVNTLVLKSTMGNVQLRDKTLMWHFGANHIGDLDKLCFSINPQ